MPASILEAGQLFASRMRMSRSIRQLWDVREQFIKYERGWNDTDERKENTGLTQSGIADEDELIKDDVQVVPEATQLKELEDNRLQKRLNTVEDFYVRTHSLNALLKLYLFYLAKIIALSSVTCNCPWESDVRQCLSHGITN